MYAAESESSYHGAEESGVIDCGSEIWSAVACHRFRIPHVSVFQKRWQATALQISERKALAHGIFPQAPSLIEIREFVAENSALARVPRSDCERGAGGGRQCQRAGVPIGGKSR